MDYRMWIENNDWTKFHEQTLREIDEAVELGGKHGVHVCLNFHRAPRLHVSRPPEAKSVWSDDEALRVAHCIGDICQTIRRHPQSPDQLHLFN